jgi:hypothetical protein
MARREFRELKEADDRGDYVAVVHPDPNHPHPLIGWRLFVKRTNKRGQEVWVHVLFGAKQVLDAITHNEEVQRDHDRHLEVMEQVVPALMHKNNP